MVRTIRLLVVLLAFGITFAHDMWLESERFILGKPGQEILIRNGNGTIYQKSENAVTPDRIAKLTVLDPSGETLGIETKTVAEPWLEMPFTPQAEGNYWIGLATKPRNLRMSGEDFTEYLKHDGIPKILKEREAKGISNREEVEQYSKYVKAYFQVGDVQSGNHAKPLGLEIEIIPLKNPYEVAAGNKLPIQVLFRGKPLSGLTLHAGSSTAPGSSVSTDTDQDGKAEIELTVAGKWYVRGIHLSQVDLEDHSYESYWATLTFEVKP